MGRLDAHVAKDLQVQDLQCMRKRDLTQSASQLEGNQRGSSNTPGNVLCAGDVLKKSRNRDCRKSGEDDTQGTLIHKICNTVMDVLRTFR
jgi:hypothetical protein